MSQAILVRPACSSTWPRNVMVSLLSPCHDYSLARGASFSCLCLWLYSPHSCKISSSMHHFACRSSVCNCLTGKMIHLCKCLFVSSVCIFRYSKPIVLLATGGLHQFASLLRAIQIGMDNIICNLQRTTHIQ